MSKIKNFFKRFIGTKAFYKELFAVSMPIALQQFVTAIVNLLDGLMVSGYGGTDAQSGVAIATKYYSSFNMIMFMFAVSCSVFIAQFAGAKMKDKIKRTFGLSIIVTLGFASLALIAGLVLKNQIMTLFTGGSDVNAAEFSFGVSYLSIVVFSFIPQSISNSFTSAFRAIKKTKVPFISACCAAVANFFLNWVLISGNLGVEAMGTKGAAIATCIARIIEMVILAVYYFATKPDFYGSFKEVFTIDKDLVKGVTKKSIPMVGAQILTEALGVFILFVYAKVDPGNSANVAAVTVTQQVNDIVVVFCGGLGTAASVLVGSRLGQNKIDEARENARWQLSYAVFFSLVAMTIMILSRGLVCYLFHFNGADADLLRLVMLIQALSFPFLIYALNVIFITRAGGYTKSPLFITNLVYYGFKLPIIILFVYIFPGFYDSTISNILINFGLVDSIVVFIFILDRFSEFIRAMVGIIVYNKAPWYKNITNIGKDGTIVETNKEKLA